jgi:glycerol-3-phosphate dehydrogenase
LDGLDSNLRRRGEPLGLSERTVSRLIRLYGAAAWRIVLEIEGDRTLAQPLVPGSDAVLAEVHHAIQVEGARTVDDVLLRRLVLLPPPVEARQKVQALLRLR